MKLLLIAFYLVLHCLTLLKAASGPYSVVSMGSSSGGDELGSFSHDSLGNQVSSSEGRTIGYDLIGKPASISLNGTTEHIQYGVGGKRYLRRSLKTGEKTFYLGGGRCELRVSASGKIETHVYLKNGNYSPIGKVKIGNGGLASNYDYFINDRYGSAQEQLDENAEEENLRRYGPWGLSLDSAGRVASQQQSRGFTGHENLPAFDLIHMNGRVYDPLSCQFVSPDPGGCPTSC